MAHGLNSMIKREIECNSSGVKNQISQSTLSPNSSVNSVNNNSTSSGNCGSAKMGSRRIFTPQFKLQVLESYRNDSDCKGNQRATARKYGIHRRQIQKWLQCENNLRSSVANLNQNSVKHQFHNISHQMPMVSAATHTNSSHNQQYKTSVLSLDTARHSVALTPMTLPLPAIPAAATSAAAAAQHQILTTTTTTTLPTVAIVARPTTKCVNGSNTATMNKTLTNTMPNLQAPYTHTPAISSAPLVVSHYHSQHHHHHHQQQQQHHHHSINQHESRLLMPSASLPVPGSPVSAATNRTDELRDYQPITVTGNCYMNEDYRSQQIYESLHYYNSTNSSGTSSTGVAPIDLSLRHRQKDIIKNDNKSCHNIKTAVVKSWQEMASNNNNNNLEDLYRKQIKTEPNEIKIEDHDLDNNAVDLTYRKRKNNIGNDEATPEKVQKTKDNNNRKDDDQQAKPVKLFKPYLLDDKDDDDDDKLKKIKCEQQDPIIWSHHPTCVNPCNYECHGNRGSNFQSTDVGYAFPSGSPTFHTYERTESITSVTPPTAAAGTTARTPPTTGSTFWCPKGSPVSGYDSASTYSDSSDYYINSNNNNSTSSRYQHHFETYSLDLKMQAIDSYYHDMTCRGDQLAVAGKFNVHRSEVQRWLDQEANIRQGIALFV